MQTAATGALDRAYPRAVTIAAASPDNETQNLC
jgi:hypothetical protein